MGARGDLDVDRGEHREHVGLKERHQRLQAYLAMSSRNQGSDSTPLMGSSAWMPQVRNTLEASAKMPSTMWPANMLP